MSLTLPSSSITGSNTLVPVSAAPLVSPATTRSSQSSGCSIYIGAEPKFANESGQVAACFQSKKMSVQSSDLNSATHFFLFVTDSFLKSKEYVLPLISKLSDPHFKQRLFPVVMDKTLSIFSPGSELAYTQYWAEILKNTDVNSSEYNEIKSIEENIAALIRAMRDTLMPPLNELLNKNLDPVTETIEKRTHLLQTKRFFFLPHARATIVQEAALAQLALQLDDKPVVTLGGEKGMGKSTLAIEYARRSERYPTGIFWLDATNAQTIEESFGKLAAQLGTSVEHAKRELYHMKDFLLIYDNVTDRALIPSIPTAHTILISDLPGSDIVMTSFTDEDAERYIKGQIETSAEDARSLASILENHPGKLSNAIAYIKSSKMPIQNYVNFYQTDRENLLAKQAAALQTKAAMPVTQRTLLFNVDPLPATIAKYTTQSFDDLSRQIKDQGIQIFVSYNWGAKDQVEQLDTAFKNMGINLLRDARELRNFDGIREFMKKVIREADYTFSVVTDSYLKSFNCLFEVITSLKDPYWRSRIFPIVLPGTNLDDEAILAYQRHWEQEAARLSSNGSSPVEAAIAQEGAQKIGPYLRFVREMQSEPFATQLKTRFQKTLVLMLARQEKLEKKGVYRQGIFHFPQGRNKDFTGREKELTVLESALKKGQYSTITNTGMGGVGKSQLALEYAYRHEKEYELIYWINSESMDTLKSDFRMLGHEMGIAEDFLKDDKLISTIKGELEKRKGWLLVFDNAEDPKALLQIMPQRGGHILVTSRNPNWTNTVSVEVFAKDEALHYLQKISGVSGQEQEIKLLAKDLGFLPLALAQAGAYIKRQQVDVDTYRAAFKEGQKHMLSQHERGYPGSVGTAWQMSIEKITQEDPNALKLLNICSYLAPDNIPEDVLRAWLKMKINKDVELDFHDALRILESYSMISQRVHQHEGTHKKYISIHRLIQSVTRSECEVEEAKSAIKLGVDVLYQQLDGGVKTQKEREAAEALIDHAKALIAHAESQSLVSEVMGELADEIGAFLRSSDDFTGAKEMFHKALKIKITVLGTENHTSVAKSYNHLGNVLQDQGDLEGAKEMHEKALKISIIAMGENHTSVAGSYMNIGNVLKKQGNLEGAKEMYEKALKIFIAALGTENHTSVADIYNNLGLLLKAQGDLKGANEMLEKALKMKIAALGTENHTSVAQSYNNLGIVLKAQGDLSGANEMLGKALKITIVALGTENHTSVANCYLNLGNVLQDQGALKGAKEMYEKALKIYIAALGTENHTSVAQSYNNLGLVLEARGDLSGAKETYEKALKIEIVVLGTENHTSVAVSYNNIGGVLSAQGDLKGAKEKFEKALKIFIAALGTEKHTSVAGCYNNLGLLLKKANGDLKGAKEMYEKALKIYIAALGTENHTSVGDCYNNLGNVLKAQGDLSGAKEMHEKALKIRIAALGTENHTSVADSYSNLGYVFENQGNLSGAKEMHEKALKIYIAALGTENHTSVSQCYNDIGDVLKAQGDLKGTKEMYEKALKLKISALGTENHTDVSQSYVNLGDVSLALKQTVEAKKHYLKAKQIYQQTKGNEYDAFFDSKINECRDLGQSSSQSAGNSRGSKKSNEKGCLVS